MEEMQTGKVSISNFLCCWFYFHFLSFYAVSQVPSILETVRQMLGLQEEQVVEISSDHPKYEVQLKFDYHGGFSALTWL